MALKTYATLNPLDKTSTLTLSGGNLVASTSSAATHTGVRSTISVSSGKWYWEYTITAIGGGCMNGVSLSSASLVSGQAYPGFDASGWGYQNSANKYNGAGGAAYGATFTTGDVIGVALDMGTTTITMYKNNASQGSMFTNVTGSIFAHVSIQSGTGTITANFGATTMTYTAPAGYNQGLYTEISPSFRVVQRRPALFKPGNSK